MLVKKLSFFVEVYKTIISGGHMKNKVSLIVLMKEVREFFNKKMVVG